MLMNRQSNVSLPELSAEAKRLHLGPVLSGGRATPPPLRFSGAPPREHLINSAFGLLLFRQHDSFQSACQTVRAFSLPAFVQFGRHPSLRGPASSDPSSKTIAYFRPLPTGPLFLLFANYLCAGRLFRPLPDVYIMRRPLVSTTCAMYRRASSQLASD